ncbi:hypothetical protein MRX96_056906 [Rhipicephalus microplus]
MTVGGGGTRPFAWGDLAVGVGNLTVGVKDQTIGVGGPGRWRLLPPRRPPVTPRCEAPRWCTPHTLCHVHEAVSVGERPPLGSETVFATPDYDGSEGGDNCLQDSSVGGGNS